MTSQKYALGLAASDNYFKNVRSDASPSDLDVPQLPSPVLMSVTGSWPGGFRGLVPARVLIQTCTLSDVRRIGWE